jgi:hypothetical protein
VSVVGTGTVVLVAEILPGRRAGSDRTGTTLPVGAGPRCKGDGKRGTVPSFRRRHGPTRVDRGPWTAEPWTVDRADGAIDAAHMTNPPAGPEVVVTGTNLTVTNPNPKVS